MTYLTPILRLLTLLVCVGFAAEARAVGEEKVAPEQLGRLAIVIGNSQYQSDRYVDLANAGNDATKISESLKRLNFDVMTGIDVTAEGFEQILKQAEAKRDRYSAVLIFYAGHGVQFQGENFLLPVDSLDPNKVEDLTARALKLNDVVARFASRDRQTFVFLDACRNNPLGKGANVSDGLAQVEVGENTFFAFATQPGNVTVDGAGDNSPFTTALLKNVEIPGLSLSDMMIRVRTDTEGQTLGRQVPWEQSNLLSQFYFTEQQVIDSAQLSADLSRILADPKAKEKLLTELASNDLQTAVLMVGETLRSSGVGPTVVTPQTEPGVQLASLADSAGAEAARKAVVSELGTLIVGSTSTDSQNPQGIDVAKSVQTELRRLGCYRMTVDGDWGKGSIRALQEFYRNTKQSDQATEPSVDLLSDLFLRSGRICREPVKVTPKKQQVRMVSDDNGSSSRPNKGAAGKNNSKRTKRPSVAAPPPDISGGIGIGGIF